MHSSFDFSGPSRRRFLATAALACVASPHVRAAPAENHNTMTLGFSTYGARGITTEQVLPILSVTGYDAVELTATKGFDAAPENMTTTRRRQVKRILYDTELVLTSLMEHTVPADDATINSGNLKRIEAASELVRDLTDNKHCVIQTVLGGGDWDKRKDLLVDQVGKWVEVMTKYDVTCCIKPHRGGGMSNPEQALWLMQQLGNPQHLRMVYDFSHYIYTGLELQLTVEQAVSKTAHVAVKDTIKSPTGGYQFKLPGSTGVIDFAMLIKLLFQGGYRGDISCEVSSMLWRQAGYDPRQAIRTCHKNMSLAFEKAGVPRPE
ncbi:MAG: sugar phosphate isomerase/epimerase [Planctomycetaceae bacterium]|nr:sugar phosphate isomerase/epimerase [Planctomycetaceae bacterium]